MKYKYEEMFPDEFLAAVDKMPVFIIPTGLLEWHGDHLPFGQDTLKSYGICLKLADHIGGGIVMPPTYIGRPGYSTYVGTLTYSDALVDLMFTEMFGQLKKVGAKVIVIITGHYGPLQVDCIKRIAKNFGKENPDIQMIAQPEYEGVLVDGVVPADHAGLWETSMFYHLYPHLTRMDMLTDTPSKKKIYENPPNNYYDSPEKWEWGNDVKSSTRELGEKAIGIIINKIGKDIKKALTLT